MMMTFHTKRGSSSRLSPLARPFTINPSNSSLSHLPQLHSHSAATLLPRSFSNFNLQIDSIASTPYCAPFDASPTFQYGIRSPIIAPDSYYSHNPSGDFQLPIDSKSTLDVMHSNGTISPGSSHMVDKSVTASNQEVRVDNRRKDKDGVVSISYGISSKQGSTPAEGSKLCGETSDHLCGKWTGILEKDNENISKDANFVSFPTTSKSCSIAMLNYPQTKLKVSCSSESSSSAVDVTGSSVSVKELDIPLDTTDKGVSHQILIDKSENGNNGKPIIDEVMDSLAIPRSVMHITNYRIPDDLTLKLPSAAESKPVDNSTKMSSENDSDLDSPCWKGTLSANHNSSGESGPMNSQLKSSVCCRETLAAKQETFADSGSVNSHLKNGQDTLCSLNPLAPHWVFSNDKQNINYYGNEHGEVDSFFSLGTASLAINLLSKEQGSANSVPAGSSTSDLRNIVGNHCSNDIHIPDKEDALKNSCSSSLLSFSSMLEPSHLENDCKSRVQLMAGPNVAAFLRVTEDDLRHASTSILSTSICSSSSCRVGVPSDFTENHGGVSSSFSRPPRLDIQNVLITMNKLSELLMENCSNDVHSLNEHERDIMKHIINNLNTCIGNRIEERIIIPESCHPYASNRRRKLADLQKFSIPHLQVTRAIAKKVPNNVYCKNEHKKHINDSASSSERLPDSLAASKDDGMHHSGH